MTKLEELKEKFEAARKDSRISELTAQVEEYKRKYEDAWKQHWRIFDGRERDGRRILELSRQVESLKEQLKEAINPKEEPWLEILRWPEWANWAAVSVNNGNIVYFYEYKPKPNPVFRHWDSQGRVWRLLRDYYDGNKMYIIHGALDWTKSLVERPKGK